ncbi:GH36-type glycosyl hydrolase domain-containing protein [Alkalisalibacterium limincola]|uniref:GH36-type glycosyl hydrolase domain-containing protein n=1 Tax=Alkalisalibacterium limincola TaxID=2699169 RepID=UPI00210236F6|nr:glucoamylase family protein [Alkalisalibacterium limincola]
MLLGTEPGIDPYTRAVSDVYQDLFGEGSFVGKGIYDVDAFERVLDGRFLENRILSHDLLEGCHARAGLVSDIKLYEDYPSRYAADVSRRYRWIRGDWQLLPWLLPWIRRMDGTRERNPLSLLSRGKLVDNLRRSLVPASMAVLLVSGWVMFDRAVPWTLWLLCLWLLPVAIPTLRDVLAKPLDLAPGIHLRQVARAGMRQLKRAAVAVALLPHEAWYSVDAIARTLWRVLVSRRRLLQWCPSSEAERRLGRGAAAELARMWAAPATALVASVAIVLFNARALPVALPILLLWFVSPWLMHWLSEPLREERAPLAPDQKAFLHRLTRRTWAFFEVHVGEPDHWLPPDNVQEHPTAVVAHRTSPTNIGLALLANLAAYDMGYLTVSGVIDRTTRTLDTLDRLARHRGHFFNWYDTLTLQPLPPRYVSSVDSGNLVGHLVTLRQGLLALAEAPLLPVNLLDGLADTVAVLREELAATPGRSSGLAEAIDAFEQRLESLRKGASAEARPNESTLLTLRGLAQAIARQVPARPSDEVLASPDWPAALVAACDAARSEAARLGPAQENGGTVTLGSLAAPTAQGPVADWARERVQALRALADRAGRLSDMEQAFLYDPDRHLLSIGYNVEENQLDAGFYDLLASEARLGTFVAIARGQLPQESWFSLGRLLTEVEGQSTLLSWSGSMFEYLMPDLVMPSYPGTLIHQTLQHAVTAQIRYCGRRGVPWGVSESGYNAVDAAMNYQYRAFGVPGLGLKRGLSQDLVIAPYASMMALAVSPVPACQNLQRLHADGLAGRFGLYEAVDYTAERLPGGDKQAIVRSFMAHHQGMGLLGLVHLLRDQPMQRRFVADPEIQATLLLLQERIPRAAVFHPHRAERDEADLGPAEHPVRLRILHDPDTPRPAVQLLSNGRYHLMLSSAGSGYSRLRDIAVTRWREDATRDPWGSFCYLRDVATGDFWSATHQPTCARVDGYEAIFSDAKAEFRGRRSDFESHLEIAVSSEDDIELRRLMLCNRSRTERSIEITTYAEVVLAPSLADEMHPAFSNLFVQTRIVRDKQALLCTRRERSHGEAPPWMFHLVAVHDADVEAISYETDRARFIGRARSLRRPRALVEDEVLSDSEGSVLDPIVAIRCRVRLKPGQSMCFDMVSGVGPDQAACRALIDKYRDRRLANRVFELAWTQAQVVRRQINASQADAQSYERLAGLMVYASPLLRARPAILQQNRRGQSGLWGQSISGDLPIALVRIADAANIELVRQMIQAHAYWRLKGLEADLVIWNEDRAIYRQHLQDRILGMVSAGPEPHALDRPGGIFVRSAHQIQQEDRILLKSVARVILSDRRGTLEDQVGKQLSSISAPAPSAATALRAPKATETATGERRLPAIPTHPAAGPGDAAAPAKFNNGLGGFSQDAREYLITLDEGDTTPAPWSNVLANAGFGTVISESSLGYTWFENAHEFRLSPWHNDPVCDVSGEALYLRDEESGHVWSPTPLPCRGPGTYRIRHGFGYTVFHYTAKGIESELWVHVDRDEPVKYLQLRLKNRSDTPRRLSVTGYVEWVLGDLRARSHMHVASATESGSGALVARNHYNSEFAGRVAFFAIDAGPYTFTTDRTEFLGRNGDPSAPAALGREQLSGRLGVGVDPCAAIQRSLTLPPGGETTVVFRLGAARSAPDAMHLAQRTRSHACAGEALARTRDHWGRLLDTVRVSTPEPDFDVLANGWLMYQTLGCRYAARSGFYQSGGAFGFRDQLQDTMATVHADPALSREHLLLCASKQFPQGDVLHWWHPPSGRGVRTRCSDDYLWLPVATCRYLDVTGDTSILDASAGFLEGRQVNVDEESYYDLPAVSDRVGSLYEHCVLALRRATTLLGGRGLPLIGTGDWNDGMNRVGEAGIGESVWLGFFLHSVLGDFTRVARQRGDHEMAEECTQHASDLARNLEAHGWDGQWYRRAWFDDGTPLGSKGNEECRIDSIAQSWSVLSGVAPPTRAKQAMQSLATHLVKRDSRLVQLLDPPFDRADPDPGYIRGYVPGVRENGGQYTHAAVWAAMAFAKLGDARSAWEVARMINPVNHTRDAAGVARYRVEPYVMAADVYAVAPHTGRGGWTWYTGSAGWMYRMMIESLLGLRRIDDVMHLEPCVPPDWPGFGMDYRHGGTRYRIKVELVATGRPDWNSMACRRTQRRSPWSTTGSNTASPSPGRCIHGRTGIPPRPRHDARRPAQGSGANSQLTSGLKSAKMPAGLSMPIHTCRAQMSRWGL